jgi:hypothetical protein
MTARRRRPDASSPVGQTRRPRVVIFMPARRHLLRTNRRPSSVFNRTTIFRGIVLDRFHCGQRSMRHAETLRSQECVRSPDLLDTQYFVGGYQLMANLFLESEQLR